MAELEIDLNQRVGEWASIQESGKSLVPLFGPGYTGLANLGNSCYLNSVVQVLFTLPEFQQRYANLHTPRDKHNVSLLTDFIQVFSRRRSNVQCC